MYFYATRDDKDSNRLMTSYGNAASQKKYGGADATLFTGLKVLGTEGQEFADITPEEFDLEEHILVRSRIHCNNPSGSEGKFVIYKLTTTGWEPTEFRCSSYGAANTLMKALVGLYGDLLVVEETGEFQRPGSLEHSAGF